MRMLQAMPTESERDQDKSVEYVPCVSTLSTCMPDASWVGAFQLASSPLSQRTMLSNANDERPRRTRQLTQ